MNFHDVDPGRVLRGTDAAQRILEALGIPRDGFGYTKVEIIAECGKPARVVLTRLLRDGDLERVTKALGASAAPASEADGAPDGREVRDVCE